MTSVFYSATDMWEAFKSLFGFLTANFADCYLAFALIETSDFLYHLIVVQVNLSIANSGLYLDEMLIFSAFDLTVCTIASKFDYSNVLG